MIRINGYAIDADDRCYVVGEFKTRTTKEGATQEYISNPKYYTKLENAFKALVEAEHRKVIKESDCELFDALIKIKEETKKLEALFREAVENHDI